MFPGVFRQLKSLTTEAIIENASSMVGAYEDDLENSLGENLVQFAAKNRCDYCCWQQEQELLELQFYKLLIIIIP